MAKSELRYGQMEFEGAIVGMAGRRNGPPLSTRYHDDDDDDDDVG